MRILFGPHVFDSARAPRSRAAFLLAAAFLGSFLVGVSPAVANAAMSTYFNSDVAPGVNKYSTVRTVKGGQIYGLFGSGGIGTIGTIQGSGAIASTTSSHDSRIDLNHVAHTNAQSYCRWNKRYTTTPDSAEYLQCKVTY